MVGAAIGLAVLVLVGFTAWRHRPIDLEPGTTIEEVATSPTEYRSCLAGPKLAYGRIDAGGHVWFTVGGPVWVSGDDPMSPLRFARGRLVVDQVEDQSDRGLTRVTATFLTDAGRSFQYETYLGIERPDPTMGC